MPKADPASPSKESRTCSVCRRALTRRPYNGIDVDVCADHGVWLDKGELESLVSIIKAQQVQRTRRVIRQRDLSSSRDRMMDVVTLFALIK